MVLYVTPRDIPCQRPEDVPCWCPLLTSRGRENVTSRGRPHMVIYVTPRDVPYRRPLDVSYRHPYMALYVTPRDVPYWRPNRCPKELLIHMVLHAMLRAISYQPPEEVQITFWGRLKRDVRRMLFGQPQNVGRRRPLYFVLTIASTIHQTDDQDGRNKN